MSGIAVIISVFIVVPFSEILSFLIPVSLAFLSAFLITGVGNALNDYTDMKIDLLAHPNRPLPSGRVKPSFALKFASLLIIISLVFTALINPFCIAIIILAILLEIGYATFIHKMALGKNVVISGLVALLFVFGGASVNQPWAIELWILALLAFIINMAREIIKDVEDAEADRKWKRETLPIKSGIRTANFFTFSFLIVGVTLSPLPFLLGVLSKAYLPLVGIADALFLYSIIVIPSPNFAKTSIKLGMLLALWAFIAGAFL
jgi:geranylgeranylglycerol-phosphate geranylgeranyltransferase